MGINAIELMPVNEFEGNSSWGYNPSMYLAVDKYYGPANDLKELIDSCHGRGIAVIMDVVLNHAYGSNPLVRMYWNSSTSQPASNNPWFNVTSPNPAYSWGYDFNHTSNQTKAFVDSVCHYWIKRVQG
ncbi:MAG: alpha-amylase family glycosyl hydrolase [Marinilabiliales bacterium]|nr:alpha-amylase family glycosyl hydrolase [Marinilabiliales bacterium]